MKNKIRSFFTFVALLAFAFTKTQAKGFTDNFGNYMPSGVTINAAVIAGLNDSSTTAVTDLGTVASDKYTTRDAKMNASLRSWLKAGFPGMATLQAPDPIPEPSTYAAILGVASLGFVMIRRRRQQP